MDSTKYTCKIPQMIPYNVLICLKFQAPQALTRCIECCKINEKYSIVYESGEVRDECITDRQTA